MSTASGLKAAFEKNRLIKVILVHAINKANTNVALSNAPIDGMMRRRGATTGWVALTTNCENGL